MGHQTRQTAFALGDAIAAALAARTSADGADDVLIVASSDLSHYQARETASRLDAVVLRHVERSDPEGLQASLDANPSHACGGGPIVAVMRAARGLGATGARVLRYADSGDVTGDTRQVVGYMSAALGAFADDETRARPS
jgi:AmmeMemoRadiSam system protein B